jgi:hypothetical protein
MPHHCCTSQERTLSMLRDRCRWRKHTFHQGIPDIPLPRWYFDASPLGMCCMLPFPLGCRTCRQGSWCTAQNQPLRHICQQDSWHMPRQRQRQNTFPLCSYHNQPALSRPGIYRLDIQDNQAALRCPGSCRRGSCCSPAVLGGCRTCLLGSLCTVLMLRPSICQQGSWCTPRQPWSQNIHLLCSYHNRPEPSHSGICPLDNWCSLTALRWLGTCLLGKSHRTAALLAPESSLRHTHGSLPGLW